LAKALAAIDVSPTGDLSPPWDRDLQSVTTGFSGIPFEERWKRFDEAIAVLRALLRGQPMPEQPRYYPVPPDVKLAPGPRQRDGIPFGSEAGAHAQASLVSRGRLTAESRPPITRRRSASPAPAAR
jgi:alkanesulfonate monooxygenase SsuD/methylene tetrahydromethanopterin reductase-like flavin-dependent oxidoreductase (luciferase family)